MNAHQSIPYAPLSMYIDGQFITAEERECESVFNPATGKVIGQLPHATTEDLDMALSAASRAFDTWRWTSPLERSRILRSVAGMIRERADEIARSLTLIRANRLLKPETKFIMPQIMQSGMRKSADAFTGG